MARPSYDRILTVRLPVDLKGWLKGRAEEKGFNVSEIVRDSLAYVKKRDEMGLLVWHKPVKM